jgi:hypothetical protein
MFNMCLFYLKATEKPVCTSGKTGDLNYTNGAYKKTFCVMFVDRNATEALNYCKSQGMLLFRIDTNETQQDFFTGIKKFYPGNGVNFFVDGQRDLTDGKWYFWNTGVKTPAYSGLNWKNGDSNTGTGLNYLQISLQNGWIVMVGQYRDKNNWHVCEFIKK